LVDFSSKSSPKTKDQRPEAKDQHPNTFLQRPAPKDFLRKTKDQHPKTFLQRLSSKIMRNFRNLQVWAEAMELVKDVYQITENLPKDEKFGLTSQMRRAAISIPANIAEGSSRRTSVDFARFLDIALGSSFELETYIELIGKVHKNQMMDLPSFLSRLHQVQKRMNALRESVLKG
jgi:four helix bundle protein